MIELKNCPNCGGILDDEGRCMYCKSKVYDLTDVNINLDTRDILAFKVKMNDKDIYFYARPTNASFDSHFDSNYIEDWRGVPMVIPMRRCLDIHMDFEAVENIHEDSVPKIVTIC